MKTLASLFLTLIFCTSCAPVEQASSLDVTTSLGIVGGEFPDPAFPGYASIVKIQKFNRMHCTGTLIGSRLVLTAAHCLQNSVTTDFEIVFPSALKKITRLVVAQKAHPEFRRKTLVEDGVGRNGSSGDLALMLLDEDAPASAKVAKLPDQALPIDKDFMLRVYGYGTTGLNNKDGDALRTTEVTGRVEALTPTKISIDQRSGKGLCKGDSGGPIFAFENNQVILVGVTSGADRWLLKDGVLVGDVCRYFSVSTQVGSYLDWIATTSVELK
ncbi:hypothetical protein AZI86_02650 [Bdellovibrio bacteriovorus]|uniref:Peptidase S1 domain-containing protein n=1 Tax=Bdellovibrio bacteriovorus TaxID=959 RepID=A0A150WNP4_BDEBC|nr:serine protease [Bdellovibrio bacteriovorus]KYG65986.1 hypothetical protein AZI86_02650 [Bdellovibrio bacteriovorus]